MNKKRGGNIREGDIKEHNSFLKYRERQIAEIEAEQEIKDYEEYLNEREWVVDRN